MKSLAIFLTIKRCWRWSDENNDNYIAQNGECRTWTNASAEEHLVMGLTAYAEGVKRCAESWGEETEEVERVLKEALESER